MKVWHNRKLALTQWLAMYLIPDCEIGCKLDFTVVHHVNDPLEVFFWTEVDMFKKQILWRTNKMINDRKYPSGFPVVAFLHLEGFSAQISLSCDACTAQHYLPLHHLHGTPMTGPDINGSLEQNNSGLYGLWGRQMRCLLRIKQLFQKMTLPPPNNVRQGMHCP